jgi:TonB family protein
MPLEVQPPISKKGIVGIRFTILPGGQIGAMTLETPSGDVPLDKAAWNAITSEGNFPPLPKEFHGPLLELRCGFFYNTPIVQ